MQHGVLHANLMNARGQTTRETLGNGIVANRSYDAVTGWIDNLQCGVGSGACAQNQSYQFDKVGNLIQRQNANLGLTENFYYDNRNRLDYSTLNGQTNLDLSYDDLGNIKSRDDVESGATWQYDSVRKHQLRQVGSTFAYDYDNNGNVTSRNGQALIWNSANYPTQITGPGETVNLDYDANQQRYKQVYTANGVTEQTMYIGDLLQKVTVNGVDNYRHSIHANGQKIAILNWTGGGTSSTHYLLSDMQGSVAKLTNSDGSTAVAESFTAYGARRNPLTWSGDPTYGDQAAIAGISREGYTGHDALGALGLNHMNGRVQDALTGRFLSADPYISEPGNTQNYNRYSYVYNNPMSMIDPSGFTNWWVVCKWTSSLDYYCNWQEEVEVTAPKPGCTVKTCGSTGGDGFANLSGVTAANNGGGGTGSSTSTPQKEKPQDPCRGVITNYPNRTGILAVPVPGTGQGNPGFGVRPGGHWGLDLASAAHADVVAAGSGTIVRQDFANLSGYGGQVIIDHRNGVFTQYGHLESFSLSFGVKVAGGDVIGRTAVPGVKPGAGNLGVGMSPHVHFEVRLGSPLAHSAGGNPINPQLCLQGK